MFPHFSLPTLDEHRYCHLNMVFGVASRRGILDFVCGLVVLLCFGFGFVF